MPNRYDNERSNIDSDREQRRDVDRRSRDCEVRLLELLCVLHELGMITDADRPAPSPDGGGEPARGPAGT
jgi:hypothetical protein